VKLGLLECDDVAGRFPEVKGGYREMFSSLLSPAIPRLEFSYYSAFEGQIPSSAGECDAWLCSGSKYSVYDGTKWIADLAAFIRSTLDEKPFVGICFGHQMLAHAMGGEVAKAPQGWGVGVLPLEILRQESWMEPALPQVRIQHMHQDQVVRLPGKSVLVGKSDHCEVGMFRVGESLLGIEGHPEFSVEFGAALIRARRERIGARESDRALESLKSKTDASTVGRWIARFLQR
jgi:GMP synthase-like glutamine amidotransferase